MNPENSAPRQASFSNKFTIRLWLLPVLLLIGILAFHRPALAQPEGAVGAIEAVEEKPAPKVSGASGRISANGGAGATQQKTAPTKSSGKSSGKSSAKKNRSVSKTTAKSPGPKSTSPKAYDGFVIGDKYTFLNFEIAEMVRPVYTIKAKEAGASGLVQVEVLIETDGTVLTAKARTGNELLHPEAEKAALATKFNKPSVYGKPARAIGFVVYRFGKREE
ncbi:MAG: energy transducer TonB [Pyrinomonadaceae bacterium]